MKLINNLKVLVIIPTLILSGCGGGTTSSGSDSTEETSISIQQGFEPGDTNSHALQTAAIYIKRSSLPSAYPSNFKLAITYADFDSDDDVDVFISSGDGSNAVTPSELFLNDGNGNFVLDSSFFNGSPPGQIHPRKALTGDYNGDGKMDMFVIGHGYDQPPFPGEAPYVILSSENGYNLGTGLDTFVGFQHAASSADIDNDNDIDVFVTDTTDKPFFLINDGSGNFTKDSTKITDLTGQIYTTELVDVDKDGFIDVLVTGHENTFPSKVLWGNETGIWSISHSQSSTLPPITGLGTVIDIDVADIDLDGDKDIFLTRTGGSSDPSDFYKGFKIQVLINQGGRTFSDESAERLNTGHSDTANWIDWIRIQDFNNDGFKDIVVDDATRDLVWLNDGVGNFQPK
jgi:hypothetical protein